MSGGPLAPGAAASSQLASVSASAIQQTAMVGLGTTPAGVAGYKVSFDASGGPTFQLLSTTDEVRAHTQVLLAGRPESFWSDLADFFSDVWHGIKKGLIAIKDFVVNAADKVANFVLQIGQDIETGVQLALQGLEEAGHFIAGVFQAVETAVEDVVDWLKALFDFGAIWRTKMAFQQTLTGLPSYVNQLIAMATGKVDGWFSKQEKAVQQAFSAAIASFQGQSYGQQPGYQSVGAPPDNTTPVAGGATAADFGNNPHHNWLQDKVSSYGSGDLGLGADPHLPAPWQSFSSNVEASMSDLVAALQGFGKAIAASVEDPSQFRTVAIPDFLFATQALVQSLLHFLDAVVDRFLALGAVAMDSLGTLLTTPIGSGFLQSLWSWIASAAGYPEDDTLNAVALMSLLAAFPTTVIYKLAAGVEQEPFPASDSLAARAGSTMPSGALLASAILQCIYTVPAVAADCLGQEAPTWLSLGLLGFSGIIWAVANGLPDLSQLEWTGVGVVAANLVWLAPAAYFVLKSLAPTLLNKMEQLAKDNDVQCLVGTVYGLGLLACHLAEDFTNPPDNAKLVAGLLLPLPEVVSFLGMTALENPYAVGAKIGFDVVGYLGGGIAEAVDAAHGLQSAAVRVGA